MSPLRAQRSDAPPLAERIRGVAKKLGSLVRLGELSNVAPRTLANYVSGRNEPKASAILAIAKAAGVSPEWLLTGEGPISAGAPQSSPAAGEETMGHNALSGWLIGGDRYFGGRARFAWKIDVPVYVLDAILDESARPAPELALNIALATGGAVMPWMWQKKSRAPR